jgi:hypothetical protein
LILHAEHLVGLLVDVDVMVGPLGSDQLIMQNLDIR